MSRINESYITDEQSRDDMLLAIIDHHRHDWLNDLQLLFGYIQLKKYDRLEGFLEKLKEKIEAERLLAHIAIPSLAIDLLYFIQKHHKFQLTVHMTEDHPLYHLPQFCEKIRQAMLGTLHLYERIAKTAYESLNELVVNTRIDDTGLSLFFVYTGVYKGKLVDEEMRYYEAEIQHNGDNMRWQLTEKHIKIELSLARPR